MSQETTNTPKKVLVKDTDYDAKLDLVQWEIEDTETGQSMVIAWPGRDLGQAIGIPQALKPEEISFFCEQIKGKSINIVVDGKTKKYEPGKFKKLGLSDLREAHDLIDQYPFYEVSQKLKNEKK